MNETEKGKTPEKPGKKKMILVALGAGIGILLLLLGSGWFTSKKEQESPSTPSSAEELEAYRIALEKRIVELCEAVEGVSDVRAAVTLNGGFETVYATETRNGIQVYTTIGSGASAKALVVAQNPPEVAGIGIVCHGGGNAALRGTLTALLSAAFRVSTNRISIAEAGK